MNPRKTLYGIVSLMGTFFLFLLFIFSGGIKTEAAKLEVPGFKLGYTIITKDALDQDVETYYDYQIGEWNNNYVVLSYDSSLENASNYFYIICSVTASNDCLTAPGADSTAWTQNYINKTFGSEQAILYIKNVTDSANPIINSYSIKVDVTAPSFVVNNILSTNSGKWSSNIAMTYNGFSSFASDNELGSGVGKIVYKTCDIENTDECASGASVENVIENTNSTLYITESKTYVFYFYDSIEENETLATKPNVSTQVYKFFIDSTAPSMSVSAPDFSSDSGNVKWLLKGEDGLSKLRLSEIKDIGSGIKEFGYSTKKINIRGSIIDYLSIISSESHYAKISDTTTTSWSRDYLYYSLEEGYYEVEFYIEDNASNKTSYKYYFAITSRPTFDSRFEFLEDSLPQQAVINENNSLVLSIDLTNSSYYSVGLAGFGYYQYCLITKDNQESEWSDCNNYTKYENEITFVENKIYDFSFMVCDAVNYCSDPLSLTKWYDSLYIDEVSDTVEVTMGETVSSEGSQSVLVTVGISNIISNKTVLAYTDGEATKEAHDDFEWIDFDSEISYSKKKQGENKLTIFYEDQAGNQVYEVKDLDSKFNFIAPTLEFSENSTISYASANVASFALSSTSGFDLYSICFFWTEEASDFSNYDDCLSLTLNGYDVYTLQMSEGHYLDIIEKTEITNWYLNVAAKDITGEVVEVSKLYVVDLVTPEVNIDSAQVDGVLITSNKDKWISKDLDMVISFEDDNEVNKLLLNFYDNEGNKMKLSNGNEVEEFSFIYDSKNNESESHFNNLFVEDINVTTAKKMIVLTIKIKISNKDWFNDFNQTIGDGGNFKLVITGVDAYENKSEATFLINVDRFQDIFEIDWGNSEGSNTSKSFDFAVVGTQSPIVKYCYANGEQTKEYFRENCTTTASNGVIKENGKWTFYIADQAGNENILIKEITDIDTAAPSYTYGSTFWPYADEWSNKKVDITVKVFDSQSNLSSIGYAIVSGALPEDLNSLSYTSRKFSTSEVTVTYTIERTGISYLVIKVSDTFENTACYVVGPSNMEDEDKQIKVDLEAPDLTDSLEIYYSDQDANTAPKINDWYRKNLYIKFNPIDRGSNGVKVKYKLVSQDDPDIDSREVLLNDNNASLINANTFFNITASGRYKIFYVATDEAGNVSTLYRSNILLDKEAPYIIGDSAVSSLFLNEIEVIQEIGTSACGYTNIMNPSYISQISDKYTTNPNDLRKVFLGVSVNKDTSGYISESELSNLLCSELKGTETKNYYLHISVSDLAGNSYEEFYPFSLKGSVPPQISLNTENLIPLAKDGLIKLVCVNDDNREVECDSSMLMPRKIYIAIGTSFVPYLEATIKYKNGTVNKITNNDFYDDLDFNKESSTAYVCFEASDPANPSNKTGDVRLCNNTEAYINELKSIYTESVDAYLTSERYLSALNNRIELKISYLDGPYFSFDKDSVMGDNETGIVDENALVNYEIQYVSTTSYTNYYVESGVYYRDVNGIHELFEEDLGDGKLIGYEIKKWVNNRDVCSLNLSELNKNVLDTNWVSACFIDVKGGFTSITGTANENYFIKYYEQNRASGIIAQTIYRRVIIINSVPEIILTGGSSEMVVSAVNKNKEDNYKFYLDDYFMCNIDGCEMKITTYMYDAKEDKEIVIDNLYDEENNGNTINRRYYLDLRNMGIYYVYLRCALGDVVSSTMKITIDIKDSSGPTITVIAVGNDTKIVLNYKSIYQERGATAIDEIDGVISSISKTIKYIDVDGGEKEVKEVDTSMLGTYLITYKAVDRSGNVSSAYRYVYIVDNSAPTIEFASNKIMGNGGNIEFSYVIERKNKLSLNDICKMFVVSVSDNYNSNLSKRDVHCTGEVNTSVAGEYVIEFELSDIASSYNVKGDGSTPFLDNVFKKKVGIIVKDTIAPTVNLYDRNEALEENERKIPLTKGRVYANLISGVNIEIDYTNEYDDNLRIFLNGYEQDYDDVKLITADGYYDIKVVDSSGNFTHASFSINNSKFISVYSDTLEETEVELDLQSAKFSYIDRNTNQARVRIDKGQYDLGDTLIISYYDMSGKYFVHSHFEITEKILQILSIDDYTLIVNVENENIDHLFSFIVDKETSQNLSFIEIETEQVKKDNSDLINLMTAGGVLVVLVIILIMSKRKKKNKKED
ncbi:MAG: DUF5011 domain-containing protein [Erysipelotrichaceae bacterium]|nr:DUF5011 domain-containing protein [Erysipelotrichaceae bacterium]